MNGWMLGLVLVMLAAVALAVTARKRLTALVALGVVGYGVALLFVYFGAPDLAITQLLVETLTVVLFAAVALRLPDFSPSAIEVLPNGVVVVGSAASESTNVTKRSSGLRVSCWTLWSPV